MGCFSACFGRCSNSCGQTQRHKAVDKKNECRSEAQIADSLKVNAEIEAKNEEQLNSSSVRKEVAFDLNLTVHEEVYETQGQECADQLAGDKGKGSGTRKQRKTEFQAFLCSKEKEKEKTDGGQGKNQPEFLSDSSEKEKPDVEMTNGEQGKHQAKVLSDSGEKEKHEENKGGDECKDQPKILSDLSEKEKTGEEKPNGKPGRAQIVDIPSDSSQSSLFTYPLNNRYKNCATSDDEYEDIAINESSLVDEVVSDCKVKDFHAGSMIQEESSESLFSLSIDSRKQSPTPETGDKEVSSPFKPFDKTVNGQAGARDRTQYVDSVLNPIDNLNQWKVVRTGTASLMKNEEEETVNNLEEFEMAFVGKENLNLENQFIVPFTEEPTVKQSKKTSNRSKDTVIAVDTSLSSWLIESEDNPIKYNSPDSVGNSSSKKSKSPRTPRSFDDRPILGALTLGQLKQMSRNSSPRRSPRFSPDETPIIGSVGSYWRHTGQAVDADLDSSCRKGKMKGGTNSFQNRLEEGMNSVATEVQHTIYF